MSFLNFFKRKLKGSKTKTVAPAPVARLSSSAKMAWEKGTESRARTNSGSSNSNNSVNTRLSASSISNNSTPIVIISDTVPEQSVSYIVRNDLTDTQDESLTNLIFRNYSREDSDPIFESKRPDTYALHNNQEKVINAIADYLNEICIRNISTPEGESIHRFLKTLVYHLEKNVRKVDAQLDFETLYLLKMLVVFLRYKNGRENGITHSNIKMSLLASLSIVSERDTHAEAFKKTFGAYLDNDLSDLNFEKALILHSLSNNTRVASSDIKAIVKKLDQAKGYEQDVVFSNLKPLSLFNAQRRQQVVSHKHFVPNTPRV